MRRSRTLTKGENWELAVLLTIMVAVLLTATLAWRLSRVPHLWAMVPPRVAMAISNTPSNTAAPSQITKQNNEQAGGDAAKHGTTQLTSATGQNRTRAVIPQQNRRLVQRKEIHPLRPVARPVIRHVDSYWFHGQRYVYLKTLILRVTSYAPDRRCCWPYRGTTTASGASVWTNHGHLVAADTHLIPFHCMVRVPGYDYDHPVPVLDRGGAIHGYRLDVLAPTFWRAQHWGVKLLRVKIYRPVARW